MHQNTHSKITIQIPRMRHCTKFWKFCWVDSNLNVLLGHYLCSHTHTQPSPTWKKRHICQDALYWFKLCLQRSPPPQAHRQAQPLTKTHTLWLAVGFPHWQTTNRISNLTSDCIAINTAIPQGCVISPMLCKLFTYDCVAWQKDNAILTFADDTTVIV